MAGTSADQLAVRRHNLALVTGHLRRHGARSRARVAEETGLNKATVSSLVAELVERRVVVEGEVERGAIGRPGRVVALDRTSYVAVGAEVDTGRVSVLVADLYGEVVTERRVRLDLVAAGPAAALAALADLVVETLAPLVATDVRPVGLTLAVPGVVDDTTGVVQEAPNLGWHGLQVLEPLRRQLGHTLPLLHLGNEANLAALAELDVRDHRPRDLLLVTGASGVGGGVVAGGRLLRGTRGFAGELGHMQVDPDGARCRCGSTGCWETVVGLGALLEQAAAPTDPVRDAETDLLQRLALLRERAEVGEPRTLAALAEVGSWLARGCRSLVNLLDPEVIVLGGYFAELGTWFAEGLRRDLTGLAGPVPVEVSTLGFSAAVRGGALDATRAVLEDPGAFPLDPRQPPHPHPVGAPA